MKIHPNDFILEELYLCLDSEHRTVLEHLSRCSYCRHRLQYLKNRRREPPEVAMASYDEVIDRGQQALAGQFQAMEKERFEAPGLFVELLGHPPEQREPPDPRLPPAPDVGPFRATDRAESGDLYPEPD